MTSTSPHNTAMSLFIRRPVAWRVKTRLARDLGGEAACQLYRAMVADALAASRASGLPLYLFHDGREPGLLPTEWLQEAVAAFPQEGSDLGDRLANAFERLFTAGFSRVILAGSDIPGLDLPLLQSAAAALDRHDVAFSPAPDGGYCLVAANLTGYRRAIFEGIAWSTAAVLEQTLAACAAAGLDSVTLESRRDIDTAADLAAYLRAPNCSAAATNAWLDAHFPRQNPPIVV